VLSQHVDGGRGRRNASNTANSGGVGFTNVHMDASTLYITTSDTTTAVATAAATTFVVFGSSVVQVRQLFRKRVAPLLQRCLLLAVADALLPVH
jgi:hypothetical protein